MAEGRGRSDWDHTATLQAQMINLMPRKGAAPVKPSALNPFRQEKKKPVRKMTLAELKNSPYGPMLGRIDPPTG